MTAEVALETLIASIKREDEHLRGYASYTRILHVADRCENELVVPCKKCNRLTNAKEANVNDGLCTECSTKNELVWTRELIEICHQFAMSPELSIPGNIWINLYKKVFHLRQLLTKW